MVLLWGFLVSGDKSDLLSWDRLESALGRAAGVRQPQPWRWGSGIGPARACFLEYRHVSLFLKKDLGLGGFLRKYRSSKQNP